jgi:acyl-CoA hydrolase
LTAPTTGPLIVYNDGPDCPRISPGEVAGLVGLDEYDVLLGWLVEPLPWLDDEGVTGRAIMANNPLRAAVADGRFNYLPVRLSAVPRLLAGPLRPTVAVVSAVPRGDGYAFRSTVGYGPAAASQAKAVVLEVDQHAPDLGGPAVPGNIVATVSRPTDHESPTAPRSLDEIDLAVGANAASIVPSGATIQVGPGGIAESFLRALTAPVGVWSGLVTDAVAELSDRDLLNGVVTAGYVWGGAPVAALADAGRLRLLPAETTHDISTIAAIPRFVACNAALQLGLDGSVNIERVGGRAVSGIGGHADYCAAASRSMGGISMIAMRSTTRSGASTIVHRVDVVSTPRCDVDAVVTEHGVAWIQGIDDAGRARRIVEVAAPEHRDALLSS